MSRISFCITMIYKYFFIVCKNNSICLLPIEYYEVGKSQGLKWIPLKDKFDYFPIGIALRRDFSLTEDVRDFIQIIKEN